MHCTIYHVPAKMSRSLHPDAQSVRFQCHPNAIITRYRRIKVQRTHHTWPPPPKTRETHPSHKIIETPAVNSMLDRLERLSKGNRMNVS